MWIEYQSRNRGMTVSTKVDRVNAAALSKSKMYENIKVCSMNINIYLQSLII